MLKKQQLQPRQNKPRPAAADPARIKPVRVLLVEDHPILREGLARRIEGEANLTVCGEAESRTTALEAIEREKPDLLILDISLKEGDGMDILKDLHLRYPRLSVLMLSMHDESLYAERAIRAGAKGYIMKQVPPEKLMEAIHKVAAGETYLSEEMTRTLIDRIGGHPKAVALHGLESLTDRELQIYQLIGRGHELRTISKELHLSVKTVASHRENIKRKLNIPNSTGLLRHALEWARDKQ